MYILSAFLIKFFSIQNFVSSGPYGGFENRHERVSNLSYDTYSPSAMNYFNIKKNCLSNWLILQVWI